MKRDFFRVLLLPLLFFIALRIPSVFEGYWYGDEGIYAAVAQEMSQGKKLYQEVWDHKPPLIFILYFVGALIGWDYGWPLLKLVNIALGFVSIVTMYVVLLKMNFRKVILFISLLFLSLFLGSTFFEGTSLNAEVVFVLFNTLALAMLLYNKNTYLVGVLIFMSLMTKVPGFVEMTLVLMAFWVYLCKQSGIRAVLKMIPKVTLGFLLPLLFVLGYFVYQNTLSDFIYANLTFNAIYSLQPNNYLEVAGEHIPKTLFKLFSVCAVLLVSSYLYWKNRLTGLSFLIVNIFVAQVFSSLLSGRNYGHYFIQLLPGSTLLMALTLQSLQDKLVWRQIRTTLVFCLLFIPLIFAFQSVGFIPQYAPLQMYYSSFYRGYLLGDAQQQDAFWWRNGEGPAKTAHFATYFNQHFLDYDSVYIYSDKPWVVALIERQITNKFIVWFHLTYQHGHLEQGLVNIENSQLVLIDTDTKLLEPIKQLLNAEFTILGTYEGFEIHTKRLVL